MAELDMNFEIVTTGREFEELLHRRLTAAGYTCELTPESCDQGVDLIVTGGDHRVAIQCKLYSEPVGNTAIQEVFAGKMMYDCDCAAVVTNSTFTDAARKLAGPTGVTLLHYKDLGTYLAKLLGDPEEDPESDENPSFETELQVEPFNIDMLFGDEPLEKLIRSSSPLSLVHVACRYFAGRGLPQSMSEGTRLLKAAILGGSMEAVFIAIVADDLFNAPKLDDEGLRLVTEFLSQHFHDDMDVQDFLDGDKINKLVMLGAAGSRWALVYLRHFAESGDPLYELGMAFAYLSNSQEVMAEAWARRALEHGCAEAGELLSQLKEIRIAAVAKAQSLVAAEVGAGKVFNRAETAMAKLDFDGVLDCLEKGMVLDPRHVMEFLSEKVLSVQILAPECRLRAKRLLVQSTEAAGKVVYGGELLDDLIEWMKAGDESAFKSLCLAIEKGYSGIIISKARQAAAAGEAWPERFLDPEEWECRRYRAVAAASAKASLQTVVEEEDECSFFHRAETAMAKLDFDGVLDCLEKGISLDPRRVMEFLSRKVLTDQILTPECRLRAKRLLVQSTEAAGKVVYCGELLDDLIEWMKAGDESAFKSLCLAIEKGYPGIIVSKARQAAAVGEEWPMRFVGLFPRWAE